MYLRRVFKRFLLWRDASIVPVVCYGTCNNAYISGETSGLSPELCAVGSDFLASYQACQACVETNSATPNETLEVYLEPKFSKLIDFCLPTAADSPSQISVASYYSSVRLAASSLGLLNVQTTTHVTTVMVIVTPSVASTSMPMTGNSSVVSIAGATLTPLSSPSATPIPQSSNKAWIAGAVAGPIALLLLPGFIWFIVKKRKMKESGVSVTDEKEKPQLHADSIMRPTYELEGEGEGRYVDVSELPAKEPVASELDAKRKVEGQAG